MIESVNIMGVMNTHPISNVDTGGGGGGVSLGSIKSNKPTAHLQK